MGNHKCDKSQCRLENLKKSRPKKLVKSTESISQKNFFDQNPELEKRSTSKCRGGCVDFIENLPNFESNLVMHRIYSIFISA